MQAWIEFGRGPLFRLAFCLMVLGLLRVVVLTIVGIAEAYRRNSDRIVPWKGIARHTLGWLVPMRRLWGGRPVYSVTSVPFSCGSAGGSAVSGRARAAVARRDGFWLAGIAARAG